MVNTRHPAAAAIDLHTILRTVHAGNLYLPVDVKLIALEVSKSAFPDHPIKNIHGENLPGFEGALFGKKNGVKTDWNILYNNAVTKGRQNFTLAHEFGHYLLHRSRQQNFECSQRDMVRWDSEEGKIEAEANRFASFMLMPIDDFKEQIGDGISLDIIGHCADRYQVSLTAAARKWIEFTPKDACIVVSRDGFILWSWASDSAYRKGILFHSKNGPRAIPESSLVNMGVESKEGVIHPQGVWWPDREVKEMTILSDQYDMAISILVFIS